MDATRPPLNALPHRGRFGAPRPPQLDGLPLPPGPMPSRDRRRPLKAWRYVGVYGRELMLCIGAVRIGPAQAGVLGGLGPAVKRLYENTAIGVGTVRLEKAMPGQRPAHPDRARARRDGRDRERSARAATATPGRASRAGSAPAGRSRIDGVDRSLDARAVIDDTAAYYERHTTLALVGGGRRRRDDGRAVAWNLVDGVNDPPSDSERTVWVDGEPSEPPRRPFAPRPERRRRPPLPHRGSA